MNTNDFTSKNSYDAPQCQTLELCHEQFICESATATLRGWTEEDITD